MSGWKEYIAVDAFPSAVWSSYPRKLYEKYINSLDKEQRLVAREIIETSSRQGGALKYYGVDGLRNKELNNHVQPGSVDLIYSWGVLEHITDPWNVFKANYEMLNTNGVVIHVIDTHPHTWARFENPYWFLTIPEWLWGLMYNGRGFINRFRAPSYIEWAEEAGFIVNIYKKEISDIDISELKRKFIKDYRNKPDEEILIDRLYMVLTKK